MAKLKALEAIPSHHFDGARNIPDENQDNHLQSLLNDMKTHLSGVAVTQPDSSTGQAPIHTDASPTVRTAEKGELVLYDPTANAVLIQAPADPSPGDSFAIKNVSTNAANGAVVSPHSGGQIEDPGTAGVLGAADAATAAIVAAGNVTRWQYLVTASSSGWWVV